MAPFTTRRQSTLFQETSLPQLWSVHCPALGLLPFAMLLSGLFATLAGCGAEQEPTIEEPTVNQHLNVSFETLPSGFEVAVNDAEVLRLRPTEATESPEQMWLEVSDRSDFGIQIAEIVSSQRAIYEALPEGSFGGNQQLQTPSGTAFYSRGRYQFEGLQVEETRVFQVHPSENRLVTFHYRYKAGEDSAERVQELFVWLGELTAAGHPQLELSTPSD